MTWKPSLWTCTDAFIAAPIGRCPRGVSSSRKRMGEKGRLGLLRWKIKSSSVPWWRLLNAIYEQDFLGFSYGFRPGRGQHDALDALAVGITYTKVSWIVDADVRSFFGASNWRSAHDSPDSQVVEGWSNGRCRVVALHYKRIFRTFGETIKKVGVWLDLGRTLAFC
jgi:hypothetical protein